MMPWSPNPVRCVKSCVGKLSDEPMAVHAELPARGATVWTRWASVDAVTCEDRTTDRRACTRSAVGARPETDSATDAGTGAPPAMEYTWCWRWPSRRSRSETF